MYYTYYVYASFFILYYGFLYRFIYCLFFFFKQKTAYEMRISDWSSDVCSSDLAPEAVAATEEGAKWIAKLVEKESNLIAMRALRKDRADYETAVESMPRTIAAYITPTREAATGIMATFEALWRDIKKLMGQKRSEERRVGKEGVKTGRSR